MPNKLVIYEQKGTISYPKFDLVQNKVTVYKGREFDINDFIVLSMLSNHDPQMVGSCMLDGQDFIIHYLDGGNRRVGLEERKVLWEKYTLFMIEVRRKLLKPTDPNHPDYVEPIKIKNNVIEIKL